jgi:dTDP-4-dehydrorhamnose 3,5-epimerase
MTVAGFTKAGTNESSMKPSANRCCSRKDNHSRSIQGVLRGLHYQLAPEPQAKLVRASVGVIYDVAVDIRRNSPTLAAWVGAELSAENKCQLWIPEGFAHGFLTLSDVAEVQYKATRVLEQIL